MEAHSHALTQTQTKINRDAQLFEMDFQLAMTSIARSHWPYLNDSAHSFIRSVPRKMWLNVVILQFYVTYIFREPYNYKMIWKERNETKRWQWFVEHYLLNAQVNDERLFDTFSYWWLFFTKYFAKAHKIPSISSYFCARYIVDDGG